VMAAVLLALTDCPLQRADAVLNELGSRRFTTAWGTRIVGRDNKLYNPAGYHYGSIWPLFTGWVSLAAFRQRNPHLGFRLVQAMMHLHMKFSAGQVPEVLHGERCQSTGVCTHQAWSESMVLQPMLEGMLGLRVDACAGSLTLRPFLPGGWTELRAEGIAVGTKRVDLVLRRETQGVRCTFVLRRGKRVGIQLQRTSGENRAFVLVAGSTVDVGCEM
jgi:glycogen debranching enzyme